MKKLKSLFHAGICLTLALSFLSPDSARADSKEKTSYIIPHADCIRPSCFLKGATEFQTAYADESGREITLPETTEDILPASLPESYDLREKNLITPVRNQGNTGCCWSFAVLKSLESNLLLKKKGTAHTLNFSENHLAWYLYHPAAQKKDTTFKDGITFRQKQAKKDYQKKSASYRKKYSFQTYYHTLPYLNGGNALFGTFVLARWSGAVSEKKAPFTAGSNHLLAKMGNQMHASTEALRYAADYILTDSICYDEADLSSIKKAIMEHGAMEVSFYYDKTYLSIAETGEAAYYQTKYTENAPSQANHCVTIAGWDDHFSKTNFKSGTPKNDGAWLAVNSYGKNSGKDGYFWISYEEASFVDFYSFRGEEKIYDHNYQYDGSGWTAALAPQQEKSQKAANMFTADTRYTQNLEAVSFYTATNKQPYTITIYRNGKAGNPESGEKTLDFSGIQDYRGYHTVRLPENIFLKAGQRFSVIISYEHTTDTNGYLPVEGPKGGNTALYLNFSSQKGESYYYAYARNAKTGKTSLQWVDLNQTIIRTEADPSGSIYHNFCVKAFTSNIKHAGRISFSVKKMSLKKNEKRKAAVTIRQTTDKKVTYQSSNPDVVSISKKGIIRARKQGTAVITASLESGASARMKVNVYTAKK